MSDNDSLRPEDFEPHRVESSASQRPGLSAVISQQPLLRLVVLILPVIAIVVLILAVFGSSKKAPLVSKVDNGSEVKDTSNTGSNNQNYQKALEEANKQKIEAAERTGSSAIVTAPPVAAQTNQTAAADPLAAFTATPVVPVQTPAPVKAVAPAPVAQPVQQPQQPKFDQQMAQSMGTEMRTIISGLTPPKLVITRITNNIDQSAGQNGAQGSSPVSAARPAAPILISAGTVIYGQTLTEADSDIPAPILVSVLSGPLQGGRAIGTFQKADEYIILAFGTIIKNKKEYKVNALAIDPETTLTGLETDVDHHYFERFVLPAAAGFISGVGNYTQQAGSSVTYSTYGVSQSYPPLNTHQEVLAGLGQSANAVANAIQQESNVPITIHVASGTPIGIMFTSSVHEVYQ